MTSLLANPCRVLANPCRDRKRKSYDTIFRNSIEIVAIEIEIEKPHQLRNRKERQQYVDWAHIDADVLEYILKMLPLADILRCRGVCTWWRSVTKTYLSISINSLPKPYQPLIVWEKDYNEPWCFFDVLRTDGGRNLYVPNTKSQELLGQMGPCVGSSSNGGYLLFLDRATEYEDNNESLYLFHPMLFSGSALHLPLISNPYGTIDIEKAVLWGDPISDGGYYGLVVLHPCYGPPLFAKCGATQFTPLECRDKDSFLDIICVKNRLYGLIDNWNFNVWDCTTCIGSSHVPRLVLEVEPQISKPFPPSTRDLHHLVESEEEILLVVVDRPARRHLDRHGGTLAAYNKVFPICEVYKMHFNNKIWERIYSLGDRVLFVTNFQSFSVSSQEFPQYQRNSIYFWHELAIRGEEPCLAIFNMEDGSLKIIDAKSG